MGAVAVTAGLPAPAEAVPKTTVEGVVYTVAADTVDEAANPDVFRGKSEDVYRQVLVVGERTFFLKGKKAPSNSKVRVTGAIAGNDFNATTVAVVGEVAGISDTGTTRVLVMLAYWTAPDSVTQTSAAAQMFTDSDGWYRDASYGALGQTGDVTPWMSITGPTTGCYTDAPSLMSRAKAAATARGYNTAAYDNFVLYFPRCGGDASGYAGWAYVGEAGTWLNGYMDRRVTVHEQGHNYGLWHSHSYMCSDGGLDGSCTFSDYGDLYDAMGSSGYVGHFNASQKTLLGWMSGRTVDLSSGGSTTLVPIANDSTSPHAAVINLGSGRSYWLEYRQPIDFDANLPSSITNGVLVHVSGTDAGSPDTGANLIDVRPFDSIYEGSSGLRAGESWTSSDGVKISVGSVSPTGATVTVTTGLSVSRLDVTRIGTGSGGVTSTPSGISCGFACAANFPTNSTVTLTATPDPGSTFSGWSGACSGTSQCTVSLVTSKTVTATFNSGTTSTPGVPNGFTLTKDDAARSATITWTPPTSDGGSVITGYQVSRTGFGTQAAFTKTVAATARTQTMLNLTAGGTYTLSVQAINAIGTGTAASGTVTISSTATVPGAPIIGTATAGMSGGTITATAAWSPPASTGGSPITGYRVRALRMSSTNTVLSTTTSAVQTASVRSLTMTLPQTGNYRFTVEAINAIGNSAQSARSNLVTGR